MSMIQNLIKKAFGTSNGNEAATFLASACNRMKAMPKEDIHAEVSEALKGVNFARAGEAPKAKAEPKPKTKTKTVYKDTPETLQKLRLLEAEAAQLRTNLDAANLQRLRELAELRSYYAQNGGGASDAERARIYKDGNDEGYKLGFSKGFEQGKTANAEKLTAASKEAYNNGFEAGEKKGWDEGWDQGWDSGLKAGKKDTSNISADEIAWRDEVIDRLQKACDAYETASKLQDITDAEYEREIAENADYIEHLQNAVEGAEFTLKAARDALEESTNEINRLGQIIDRLAAEKKAQVEEIAALNRNIAYQKKQTQDYNRSYSAAMNQAENYKYQLDAAQKENEALRQSNEELKEESNYNFKMCDYLQTQIDNLKKRGVLGSIFGA